MFVASKLFWVVLVPSNLLVVLLIAALLLGRFGHARWSRGILWFVAASMASVVLLPLGQWLAMPLENRFPRPHLPAHVDGILVLGFGADADMLASRGMVAHEMDEPRLVAGAELARTYPGARLVFSGGPGVWGGGTEADVARFIFRQIGVPPQQIIFESRARTTWENLLYAKALIHPRKGETWILVTSAFHLPRAIGVAQHLGWRMIPWPAAYFSEAHGGVEFDPHYALNMIAFEEVVHEWLGLVVYRLEGRTDALFPRQLSA